MSSVWDRRTGVSIVLCGVLSRRHENICCSVNVHIQSVQMTAQHCAVCNSFISRFCKVPQQLCDGITVIHFVVVVVVVVVAQARNVLKYRQGRQCHILNTGRENFEVTCCCRLFHRPTSAAATGKVRSTTVGC